MSHHEAAGCPFYGYAFAHATADEERRSFGAALIARGGNQCALVTNAHSPCAMETAGTDPSWQHCGRNPSAEAAGERPSLTQIAAYLPVATTASDEEARIANAMDQELQIRSAGILSAKAEYARGVADACAWVIGMFALPPKLK
jgi:hypothetical protein